MRFGYPKDQFAPNVVQDGWYVEVPPRRGHYCYPPKAYPSAVGAGAKWKCTNVKCQAIWVSEGIQPIAYPVADARNDAVMGPERWLLYSSSKAPDFVRAQEQEGLYDWRPIAPYYVRLWRAQLEAMNVDWTKL